MTTSTSAASAPMPLTTVFTPPASCSSVNWVSSDCSKSTCDGLYNIVQTTDPNCYPSGWATTSTWFSPGLFCPTGYTVNDTNVVTSGLGFTETQARCCPSGYTFATKLMQPWWTPEPCTKVSAITTTIDYTVLGVTPTTTTAVTYTNPIIHAYPVELRWQSTDSVDSGIKTSATGKSSSNTDTSAAITSTSMLTSSTSTSSAVGQPASSSSSSSGLSAGAKAGIGVGIAAAAIIVIILSLLFWFRRRRQHISTRSSSGYTGDGSNIKKVPQQEPAELPSQSDPWAPELQGTFSTTSELDGGGGFGGQGHPEIGQVESQIQRSSGK